jgi:NNP family nitrate/nitrite transporter-like MFS transporter
VGAALGSVLRPVGGHLADRHGGTVVLTGVYGVASALLLFTAGLPPIGAAAVAFPLCMGALGAGNGAVFQLVGLRFRERIGVMTGLVGAAGGLGGFFLPTLLGTLKDAFGTYAAGLGVVAGGAALALVATLVLRGVWRTGWTNNEAVAGVKV